MYVVQVFGGSNYYTDDFEDALRVYHIAHENSEEVEILKGEPGYYKVIYKGV